MLRPGHAQGLGPPDLEGGLTPPRAGRVAGQALIAILVCVAAARPTAPAAEHPDIKPRIAIVAKTAELFAARKFAEMDSAFESYRKRDARSPNGAFYLLAAYEGLFKTWIDRDRASANTHRRIFSDWMTRSPQSPTPRVALATAILVQANDMRRHRYWAHMTKAEQDEYSEFLRDARRVLEADGRLAMRCPQAYLAMEDVLGPSGVDSDDYRAFLEEVIKKVPWYAPLTNDLVFRLQPKWGGEPDEWEKFGRRIANLDPRYPNWEPYARMAWEASDFAEYQPNGENLFKRSSLDWNLVKAGFEQMLQRFPKSRSLPHVYAWMACLAQDRRTAAERFRLLGTEGDATVWYNTSNFLVWRRWALGPAATPESGRR